MRPTIIAASVRAAFGRFMVGLAAAYDTEYYGRYNGTGFVWHGPTPWSKAWK